MRFLYCASYIMHCRKREKERENSILYFVYSIFYYLFFWRLPCLKYEAEKNKEEFTLLEFTRSFRYFALFVFEKISFALLTTPRRYSFCFDFTIIKSEMAKLAILESLSSPFFLHYRLPSPENNLKCVHNPSFRIEYLRSSDEGR